MDKLIFFMNFQITSVRTLFISFNCGFVYKQGPIDAGFLERLKLKDDAVPPDPTVMSHYKRYYIVTIALSFITDRWICTERLSF